MGPNAKARPRKQYVKYRLRILKELEIPGPDAETIERMLDVEKMSEGQVDAIFLGCIQKAK